MRIGLLVSQSGIYSHGRFKDVAESRGHEFIIINLHDCFVNITSNKHHIYYKDGQLVPKLDAVIPRIVSDFTEFGSAVLRQFEMQGVFPVNNSLSIVRAQDKLRTLQILAKHNIPMPATGFAHSPENTDQVIKSVGGAPLVIKLINGMEGKGVVLAETKSAATSVVNAFKGLNADILVQQFIKESSGRDLRLYVVGDKVVASMERVAQDDEFRANVALGASVQSVEITKKEERLAVKATKALGLDVAGVDILRSDKGPLIIEVNSCAGLQGIERASGVDVAASIIDFLEAHVKPYRKRGTA